MPQCPKCGAALKDDYGMSACSQCQSFLFIDMDGIAHISVEEEPSTGSEPVESPLSVHQNNDQFKEQVDVQLNDPAVFFDPAPALEPDSVAPPPIDDGFSGNDPLGLNAYAASELSAGKDGFYLYRLFIAGVDTKEMRQSLRREIEDSRFGWDPDQLMDRLDKGRLVLEDLSPVKTSILVSRLMRLPLHITWEQYAITDIQT